MGVLRAKLPSLTAAVVGLQIPTSYSITQNGHLKNVTVKFDVSKFPLVYMDLQSPAAVHVGHGVACPTQGAATFSWEGDLPVQAGDILYIAVTTNIINDTVDFWVVIET